MGPEKRLRLYTHGRLVRSDAFLASLTRSAHFVPPANEFKPSELASHALTARRLGLGAGSDPGNRCHSENLVGLARQPSQRSLNSIAAHRRLHVPKIRGWHKLRRGKQRLLQLSCCRDVALLRLRFD